MTFLPDVARFPLRIGADPETLSHLQREPLLFAAHYAALQRVVKWPESILRITSAVNARYAQHDEVLKLIETLRSQVPMALSADLARSLAEGLELHDTFQQDPTEYAQTCENFLEAYSRSLVEEIDAGEDSATGRLEILSALMAFSPAETQVLRYALCCTVHPPLQLFTRLFCEQRVDRNQFWQITLEMDAKTLSTALSSRGRLAGTRMFHTTQTHPSLSEFWAELLINTGIPLTTCILQPLEPQGTSGETSRLPPEDREILEALLYPREVGLLGINALLYGKTARDKHRLARSLILASGAIPYTLNPDIPDGDRPTAVMMAQCLLAQRPERTVLVVEKAQSVLTRVYPEVFGFMGFLDEAADAQPLDQRILGENPIPTLWLSHEANRLHPETLGRFLFHAEALKGTRADRKVMVESLIETLPVAPRTKLELVKLEGLSEQQVSSAKSLAKITAGRSRRTYARHLLLAAQRSQKALARKNKDEARMPVTQYSLDYLNSAGRFGPAKILQSLRLRPQASLCLYGLPGTGKTQFAEHLAQELGYPLLTKRASELFDKYVGESEKRMSEAFDQAEEEGAILLLDEADSFLADRTRSRHQWEVSIVNELLQQIERFEGIFICATNLYSHLDIAALRRFTFKLEFLPLNFEQRWEMFLNEADLRNKPLSTSQQADYEERLILMKNLTPGDFATVKRQCLLLGESLSPREWLDQLELEVQAKQRQSEDYRAGEVAA
ncbi:ATP-binding protein [Denitratisoma oestradiolicum]|uniref:ATPase n=3 Tax=Denitratisoma oestradiolicum TaxID=311182 RepID=A0A6S6Y3L1_9PROT|nr:ATP-binding protein [Denitratisoma oestradiolicum]TWO78669.1 hypothetical protein CBW56_18860 [Denitratisoma oestradiolicum]CAB1369848.1 ATPase [Denitratisoma oestradiolicum]